MPRKQPTYKPGMLKCPYCVGWFSSASGGLQRHIKSEHLDEIYDPEEINNDPNGNTASAAQRMAFTTEDVDSMDESHGVFMGGFDDEFLPSVDNDDEDSVLPLDAADTPEALRAITDQLKALCTIGDRESDDSDEEYEFSDVEVEGGDDSQESLPDHSVDDSIDEAWKEESEVQREEDQMRLLGDELGMQPPLKDAPLGHIEPFTTDDHEYFWPMTVTDQVLLDLLEIVNHMDCPMYAFDLILRWASDAARTEGFSFLDHHPTRKTFMGNLHKEFCAPEIRETRVKLERHKEAGPEAPGEYRLNPMYHKVVQSFHIRDQIMDLLNDTDIFGNLGNLVVNQDNPFIPYRTRRDEPIDEILTGSVYQKAANRYIKDEHTEFLLPLVLYLDKTGLDRFQRYNLEPVLFTFAFFRSSVRRQDRSWRTIGYVNDLGLKSKAQGERERSGVQGAGRSFRNYHRVLGEVLSSLVEIQENPIHCWVRMGQFVKFVKLVPFVNVIIGDMKSGDCLVGKKQSSSKRGENSSDKRAHRACDCPLSKLSDYKRKCNFVDSHEFLEWSNKCTGEDGKAIEGRGEHQEYRKKLEDSHQHRIPNHALANIRLGDYELGMASMQPGDEMHFLKQGICPRLSKALFDSMTPVRKVLIDEMVMSLAPRQTERDFFPSAIFAHGVTNLTMVTAEEHPGIVFTILLLSLSEKGRNLLTDAAVTLRLQPEQEAGKPPRRLSKRRRKEIYAEFIKTLEYTLCFQAWYEHGTMWCRDDHEAKRLADCRIRTLMKMIIKVVPREDGNGWDIPKMHEMMHVTRDVNHYGRMSGYSSSKGEQLLKPKAKKLGKTVQKRGETTFTQQSIERERDAIILARINRKTGRQPVISMDNRNSDEIDLPISPRHTTGNDRFAQKRPFVKMEFLFGDRFAKRMGRAKGTTIDIKKRKNFAVNTVYGTTKQKGELKLPSLVHHFITEVFAGIHESESETNGFTTDGFPPDTIYMYQEAVINKLTFRASPNFRSGGSWYDWAMVRYKIDDDEQEGLYPAKILAFVSTLPNGGDIVTAEDEQEDTHTDNVWAVIHTCQVSNHNNDSLLSERWVMETEQRSLRFLKPGVQLPFNRPDSYRREAAPVITYDSRHWVTEKKTVPGLRMVPLQSIVDRVYVFEETPGVVDYYDDGTQPIVHLIHERTKHWPEVWENIPIAGDVE